MNKTTVSIKLQIITVYVLIALAVGTALFSLGFMTNSYNLFMDGNDEMFNFFKSVQELNNSIFGWSIAFLVLSLLYFSFELHRVSAGFFGLVYTLLTGIFNGIRGYSVLVKSSRFRETYGGIDFSSLETYRTTVIPFTLSEVFALCAIFFSLALFALCLINFINHTRKGGSHEA